jgi:hypothetical protein
LLFVSASLPFEVAAVFTVWRLGNFRQGRGGSR